MADAMKLVPVPRIKPEIVARLLDFVEVHAQSEDEHDREEAAALAVICARMNAAASPPAREEAPAEGAGKLAEIIRTRLLGVRPSDQDVALEDRDWLIILSALRNRTSEPEAGEVIWRVKDGQRVPAPATADKLRVAAVALEPFARAADKLDGLWAEDDWRWNESVRSNVTVRDIRRAAQALAALNEGGE